MSSEKFVWFPTQEIIQHSNLKRFMDEYSIQTFQELRLKSVEDISWFWDSASKFLRLEWFTPYSKVVDTSAGIPWAKWFIGGKINIAYNCLDKQLVNSGGKTALIYESESGSRKALSFSELSRIVNQIANVLANEMGIRKGDKVGVFMPMIPETVAAFLAVAKIGAVVIPIFSGYGSEALVSRLSDCAATGIITADSFPRRGKKIPMLETCLEAARVVPSVKSVLVFQESSESGLREASGQFSLFPWRIVDSADPNRDTEAMDSEDPFMIIYTSGTTGKPKGAVHVHGGFLVKITEEVAFQADLQDDDILFWFTDIGWIMAPWEIVGVMALGGTLLIYDGAPDYPGPGRLWNIVEENRVTKLGISPTLVRSLMRHGEAPIEGHDLSSLRAFGSTGEPWNPESYRWLFEKVGKGRCPIINLSGGTEVGACFLSVHPIVPVKECSLGGPCLGIDADVFDEKGRPVRNQTGELVIKKPWPSMTRGLWKSPERYLETYWSRFPDVWVHGDWASIDEDGYWFLHGRSDDTIKVSGKRIGPAEVESVLSTHKAVLESIAIGVPDSLKGESLVCFVVLRPGFSAKNQDLVNEIKQHVAKALGAPLRPSDVFLVPALPKTRNAKLVRRLVKARYLQLPLGDTSNIENPEILDEIPTVG